MMIRTVRSGDATDIAQIYDHYVATSHATFELEPVGGEAMLLRIDESLSSGYPFLVCEAGGEIAGYAYARRFRPRPAYRHSAEVSVYIRRGHDGKGIATRLYERLFEKLNNGDLHAIIAGISLPNEASVALHTKFGFKKVAHFHEVGRKFDRWIDVGYWQLILTK
jgi:L-amino acid N-acyltransferase YncA